MRPVLACGVLVLTVIGESVVAAAGVVSVTIRDSDGGAALPCRAWVDADGERLFEPESSACTPYKRDRSFTCDGAFSIRVPAGKAVVHVERGKEYVPVDQPIVVEDNQTVAVKIELRRWVDIRMEGWYSADLHVHFGNDDLRVLKQMALADDVNLLPAFTYWNNAKEHWPPMPQGPSVKADAAHLVTLRNEEIERIRGEPFESVGAPFFFGLVRPVYVEGMDPTHPCDAALCRLAKKTSPGCVIDTDKPLWAENPVGVALGLFDCAQVCHNHFHRDKTLHMGWGMAGSDIEEEKKDWGREELLLRGDQAYYRWLNCGFRLAASGGSAIGVMPVPLGYSRTYAKLDGPLTEANYLAAIRAGRTFATTGPMLLLTVNDRQPGATIAWSSKQTEPLQVRADLRSIQPIEALELIQNGEVVQQVSLKGEPASPVLKRTLDRALTPKRSGWVAARALFRCPDGTRHQAHTSPVYVAVDGKPVAFKRDAEYMIRWIDRITQVSADPKRYRSQPDRAESQGVFLEARRVYERIARTAAEVWND